MKNATQIERYKKLIAYINEHFKEDINIEKVEEICHYSYRNINRIFEALHGETIGKFIKRLRLEKAAQYLKYSTIEISDIAVEVGFEDRAAFSKAFKNRYQASPLAFRNSNDSLRQDLEKSLSPVSSEDREKLAFTLEHLPSFFTLFIEYRGSYLDHKAIEKTWTQLIEYAGKKGLWTDNTIIFTEIIDDIEISDALNSRYNFGLVLEEKPQFSPEGFFQVKEHKPHKYVKFIFEGLDEHSAEFYQKIYAFWMEDVNLELADLPSLEFYPNYSEELPREKFITEIYIPVH